MQDTDPKCECMECNGKCIQKVAKKFHSFSREMASNDVSVLANEISNHVKLFHANPSAERARSAILEKFQHTKQALQVSLHILQNDTDSDYVSSFAAHTIVQKVQSGTVAASMEFASSLLSMISKFGSSTKHASITKMLCQGYVDYVLLNYSEVNGSSLSMQVSHLPAHCVVVIFTLLPEEARSPKLFPKGAKRGELYNLVIADHSSAAIEAIQKAGVSRESLQGLKTWIRVQRFSSDVRMRRTWGDTYSCVNVVRVLPNLSLFRQSLAALHNPAIPLATAELCSEIVAEALRLTNDPGEEFEFIVSLGETICELGKALTGAMPIGTEKFLAEQSSQDTQLVGRIRLFCVLQSEFALVHYIPLLLKLLVGDESGAAQIAQTLRTRAQTVISSMSESALHFVQIRHHEIALQALDFWYNLLSALLGATDIEDDEDELFVASDEAPPVGGTTFSGARSMHLARRFIGDDDVDEVSPVIAPFFKRLLPALVQAMCFPVNPDMDVNFDPELFTQFREMCGTVLCEACEVVEPLWMIQMIGETLGTLLANHSFATWHNVEACIQVLTAVAPRLPAGGDPVIPMMLENIPRLAYPETGQPAVLMRGAVGRLVLYTSVYLATRTQLCSQIVLFFCSQVLPFLSAQRANIEVLNSAQSACAQAVKMSLHSARRALVAMSPESVNALLDSAFSSALDERLSLDSRLQIVRGVGSVLSELGSWRLIHQSLSGFALRAGQQAQNQLAQFTSVPNNPNAMGPASVKVYISLLSAITALPDDPAVSQGDSVETDKRLARSHPVLCVLAEQWTLVESICQTVGCQYADIAQVMATSFVQIFAHTRSFASHSVAFLPALRTAAQCFLTRPISDWMHMVRSFVSMFGEYTRVDTALVETLCQLSETFVKHSAEILTTNTEMRALTFDEARMVGETFEVLSEVLRFVDLASIELKQVWFRPIAIVAVQTLYDSPVDAQTLPAITALLRFTERLVTWIDPPPVIHAAADTERVCFETAACVRGWLQEAYYNPSTSGAHSVMQGGNLIDTLILALGNIWAVKSSEFTQILPSVSTSLRISLNSSLGPQVANRLQQHAQTDWVQIATPDRLRTLFSQMDASKRDSRTFGRIVADMAKEFHAGRKHALFNQTA